MIKLSILIPTLPSRNKTFLTLVDSLQKQIGSIEDIEIIGFFDNKKRHIGEKRNNLLKLANGKFVVSIDDDDRIADDYISSVIESIDNNPDADCITYTIYSTFDNWGKVWTKHSKDFWYDHTGDQWTALPDHKMVWRSEIAKKHLYNNVWAEDIDWAKRAYKDIKNEVTIDKVLYYYIYSGKISEAEKPK